MISSGHERKSGNMRSVGVGVMWSFTVVETLYQNLRRGVISSEGNVNSRPKRNGLIFVASGRGGTGVPIWCSGFF